MAHVLLVEDNTPIRLLLTEFLETAGHRVEGASDGAEALERMRQERIDELKTMRLSELADRDVAAEELGTLEIKYDLDKDKTYQRWLAKVRTGARVTCTRSRS